MDKAEAKKEDKCNIMCSLFCIATTKLVSNTQYKLNLLTL